MRRGIKIMNLFFFVLWWKSNIDNNSPILPPIIDIKSRVFSLMRHLFLQALTLSIRIKTNCGFPTLQNLQRFYTITCCWQEHPHKRRLFSFLLYRSLLLCQLPLVLSANGEYYLHDRSRRMDLYSFRSSDMVSLPVPASGNLYFRFSGEAKLHYILSSWK